MKGKEMNDNLNSGTYYNFAATFVIDMYIITFFHLIYEFSKRKSAKGVPAVRY
jgi:hypothetical protein